MVELRQPNTIASTENDTQRKSLDVRKKFIWIIEKCVYENLGFKILIFAQFDCLLPVQYGVIQFSEKLKCPARWGNQQSPRPSISTKFGLSRSWRVDWSSLYQIWDSVLVTGAAKNYLPFAADLLPLWLNWWTQQGWIQTITCTARHTCVQVGVMFALGSFVKSRNRKDFQEWAMVVVPSRNEAFSPLYPLNWIL